MHRLVNTLFKAVLASFVAGIVLSFFGVTMESLLGAVGQTPETLKAHLDAVITWAIPKVMLGSVIVLPIWLFTYIFLPPRD